MVRKQPFTFIFDPEVKQHLRVIDAKHRTLIRATVEEQLEFEPLTKTRNRKPLKRPVPWGATWELRFGPGNCFRVFYSVAVDRHEVNVLAIGVKENNRLFVGGEEIA
jgi:mRNA-degrading endonuclease RelE of RelBE toxin-antitoxin system